MTAQTMPRAGTGSKRLTAPCGCGCGGDPCGCSGGHCDAVCGCRDGLLVQPHFFAGQLLTDDDLQALTNYVVAKHRLHNRFVVGSGVACGLAVACHPCDPGKVSVQPGYAIDCCGNDILVPCPVELDINAMARDLKFKRLGMDCGDPCADKPAKNNQGREKRDGDCEEPADRYCLYLNYCESPTDPLAPYSHDEGCATACQPSRLREGYRFELRCPKEEDRPPSILDRLRCCLGDLDEAEKQSREFERGQYQLQRAKPAVRAFAEQKTAQFADDDVALMVIAQQELADVGPLFPVEPAVDIAGEAEGEDPQPAGFKTEVTEKVLRHALDNVQALGAAIARFQLLDERQQAQFLKKHPNLESQIEEGGSLLRQFAPRIRQQAPLFLTSPIELAAVDATVDSTLKYIDSGLSLEERRSFEGHLYAYNAVSSKAHNSQVNHGMANFKSWLLRKMHQCPPTTECCLVKETSSIVIPAGDGMSEEAIDAADALARAFVRYLLDCVCSALIPPCPTCEDPAVKLACLEVKNCKVDNICNLERTFLLTESNLRYWLPFLHGFGELLEKICCEFSKLFDRPIADSGQYEMKRQVEYFASGQQASKSLVGRPMYANLLRVVGLSADTVNPAMNFAGSLRNVVVRQPQIAGMFQQQAKVEAASNVGTSLLAGVFAHRRAKEAIQIAAGNQLGGIESRVEARAADSLKAAEELHDRMASRVRNVEDDLEKRLTVTKLSSTKVIRDLKSSLAELRATNQDLVARLKKLERGR